MGVLAHLWHEEERVVLPYVQDKVRAHLRLQPYDLWFLPLRILLGLSQMCDSQLWSLGRIFTLRLWRILARWLKESTRRLHFEAKAMQQFLPLILLLSPSRHLLCSLVHISPFSRQNRRVHSKCAPLYPGHLRLHIRYTAWSRCNPFRDHLLYLEAMSRLLLPTLLQEITKLTLG